MTDLNPEIWDNPTLGAAAQNENLERLTKQQLEDRAAAIEDREPRTIVNDNTYPGFTPPVSERTGTTPSNYSPVRFEDEQPNDVIQSGENQRPEGMSDEDWAPPTEDPNNDPAESSVFSGSQVPDSSGESASTNPPEESGTTTWK